MHNLKTKKKLHTDKQIWPSLLLLLLLFFITLHLVAAENFQKAITEQAIFTNKRLSPSC